MTSVSVGWTVRLPGALIALTGLCLHPNPAAPLGIQTEQSESDTFTSPAGKFRVAFRVVEHRTFSAEESLRALDNVDHVEYALTFTRVLDGEIVAEVTYPDVYGLQPGTGPTAPAIMAAWLDWSPGEDFVILPDEGWASAPGTPERTALSLSDSLDWSTAPIAMDTLIWVTPLIVVGDQHSDCHYAVDVFDGATGQRRALDRPPDSPVGYEIHAVEGRTVVIRRVLDNCSRQAERDAWVAECSAVDLDGFVARPTPCPGAPGAAAEGPPPGPDSFPAWVSLFDQELVDWLANEYRASDLCAVDGVDFTPCYERMMEPLVKVLPVRRSRSIAAPSLGQIVLVAVPGKALTAHISIADGPEAVRWATDLYDPDWGYGPYLHQTFLAREGNWFFVPADPFDEPVWILLGSGREDPEVMDVRRGDILDFENSGWVVIEASGEVLTVRREQDSDMWCEPGDPPPLTPAPTRTLSRSDVSDARGHLLIRPKYLRGC
jgi:hypothetical protein